LSGGEEVQVLVVQDLSDKVNRTQRFGDHYLEDQVRQWLVPILGDSFTDLGLNKAAIIERCIRRMHEEYAVDESLSNPTHQDALILNIERACQAAIDLAMHVVSVGHQGVPQASAEAFSLLQQAGKLDGGLASRLGGMTGFRNIAVHQYQKIDLNVIHYIMQEGWRDLVALCTALNLRIEP
jgi:uncharacterized protein YutE (UPF0331/DUF86 family)